MTMSPAIHQYTAAGRRAPRNCLITSAVLVLALNGCKNPRKDLPPAESMGSTPAPSAQQITYKGRVGIAVTTAARSCVAIENANLTAGTPVTLISPAAPQTTQQAELGGTASNACPITKEVDPAVSNYDLQFRGTPGEKLKPFIAIIGTVPITSTADGAVQTDLEQNQKKEAFRACGTQDGIHLTVWQGAPLNGTLLWHGFFYDPSSAVTYPACTPKETTGP